ncbi:MAG: CBM35 domain-containing protein, partial [Elusimicrobiota bacterium]|nr:glycosyl hydrolase [Endomicrobiia bacterium]MDW8166853.1 CBM35 domain-containing protein [Elusimicrobiota bacterium]
ENTNDSVEVSINLTSPGIYEIQLRYAAPYGYKENYLYINDQLQGSISFPETTTFSTVSCGKIYLSSGTVKLKVQSFWGWFELDSFILVKANISSFNISKTLVNPNAIPNAKKLISFLVDNYGKKIISGQWSSHTASNDELDYIKTITNGKQPAIWGLDMLYYSGSAPES